MVTKKNNFTYVSLYSKVSSGDSEALKTLKEAANENPTAAYYLAAIHNNGCYKGKVDADLSLAYYCLASYLGSDEATEHLNKQKTSIVKRCLDYIRDLGYEGQFDFNYILNIIRNSHVPVTDRSIIESRKKNFINQNSEQYKLKRDEYNSLVREWKTKRDGLNDQVRELSEEIDRLTEDCDNLDKRSKILEGERKKYNDLANEAYKKFNERGEFGYATAEKSKEDMEKFAKIANEYRAQINKIAEQIQKKNNDLKQLRNKKNELREKANDAHKQLIEYGKQSDVQHELYTQSLSESKTKGKNIKGSVTESIFIKHSSDPDATKVVFMDFNHRMDEVKYHDPTFGVGLREQFKTSSVKTSYIDIIDMFRDVFLKNNVKLYISTSNYVKKWEKDRKNPNISYLKNIAIRVNFNDIHDLVLIADLINNPEERIGVGYKFEVKGFVFVDVNMIHFGEIEIISRVYAKLDQDKGVPWIDFNGVASLSNINNQINDSVVDYLLNNNVTLDSDCISYMKEWKRYIDSRSYILGENEKQKMDLTSVNLQMATFCDDCTEEIRLQYETIPFVKISPDKRQGWFTNQIDDDHFRKVLLLHVSKEYDNKYYQDYISKTDYSFKKKFDQFTRDGLKLYSDNVSVEDDLNLDDIDVDYQNITVKGDEPLLSTYDSRIANTFVEIVRPDAKIKALENKYSEKRLVKNNELLKRRDESIDLAQEHYRNNGLLEDIKLYRDGLEISEEEIIKYAKLNNLKLTDSIKSEIDSRLRDEKVLMESQRLVESNYLSLKNKFDIQYTNALSEFDSIESQEFNDEKERILLEGSTLCLHAYFDLSEDYDVADENRLKALNDAVSSIDAPYIRRNLDGDRVLLRRQSEGINNLMQGFVMNPYLTTFLFRPQYRESSDLTINADTEFYQNLNDSQRATVVKALSSNGLYLIQGPPGTGKTQTIAEIVTQLAKSGKKILIASQNNKAVDTAFSRLPEMPDIRPVRVLRDVKDNQYSYDNLTDNLYKNIIGSLNRQIKKHSDEHKYVNESKLLIEKLTEMKNSIETIESQLGDLERDIESHEGNKAHYLLELAKIREEIGENKHKEEHYNNISESLKTGKFDNYLSLIEEWPEKLTTIDDEKKELLLRSLIVIDEDDFMDALADPEDVEEDVEEDKDSEDLVRLSTVEVASVINSAYPDIVESFEVYHNILEQIQTASVKNSKNSLLFSKKISGLLRTEGQITDKLQVEENYIKGLKKDIYYQTLLKERNEFNKELAICFSELEIEVELDQESAIDVIKRTIADVKRKLGDKKSKLEERIVAYQKIVDYLSDNDVLYSDKSRINDVILKYVNVIGITCSKAHSSARIKYAFNSEEKNIRLNSLNIDVVILDETSKIPFSELVPPILYGKTVILVGDHRQLPPVYSEINKEDFNLYNSSIINQEDERTYRALYTESFFGKLFQQTPDNCKSTLTIQYRMHPQIMDLVNTFYPDTPLEFGGRLFDKEHRIQIAGAHGQIISPEKHVLFINCNGREKRESGTMSSYNSQEAEVVVRILDLLNDNCHLDRNGNPLEGNRNAEDDRLSLGVICPYRGQVNRIRDLKKASYRSFNESFDEKFMISTVDNFQGDERDIIVLSMVRTEQCDWLSEYRRINVAMSRARRLLIIVGNEYGLSNIDVSIETSEGTVVKKAYGEIIKRITESGCRLESGDIIGGVM